ncbi:MAG: carbohydrate ABC transporter permease [Candidatus Merdivicinus sp.]|jgi:putative aldouronate transport system permease protein
MMKDSIGNRIYQYVVTVLLILLAAACILPFVNLLAISLSASGPVMSGQVLFWPKEFTTEVYRMIIKNGTLLAAMRRTIILTVVYVLSAMVMTILCAYPLSEPTLKGKNIFWPFILFTMYFSGGMIPGYLLVNALGLIDTYAALILPGILSTYNMIVMRSFFTSIPASLKESAFIDGANDLDILLKIVLPLSKPVLATIALFYAVARWNGIQDALLYINSPDMAVLQMKLKSMIESAEAVSDIMEGASAQNAQNVVSQTVRSGSLIFSIIPVLIVYPFLQKYFVKGVMIGAVKG